MWNNSVFSLFLDTNNLIGTVHSSYSSGTQAGELVNVQIRDNL